MTVRHPPGATKLIADAKEAGRKVDETTSRTVINYGRHDGVVIYENGSIIRYGIDLTVSKRMSLAAARHVLKL